VRYGYRRVHVLLEREGWGANHKLAYRLYREEGLALRRKRPKRHVTAAPRGENPAREAKRILEHGFHSRPNGAGTRLRALTVRDVFTRECLAIVVGQSLKGEQVVALLRGIAARQSAPKLIFCDNGSELVGRVLDLWVYVNRVRIDFSRPGKPTANADVESFNGRLRDECLNSHWSMADAKRLGWPPRLVDWRCRLRVLRLVANQAGRQSRCAPIYVALAFSVCAPLRVRRARRLRSPSAQLKFAFRLIEPR
jgi:putative transposase